MRITVNGHEIEVRNRLDIRMEVDPAGESFGDAKIEIINGTATLNALTITGSHDGKLIITGCGAFGGFEEIAK